MSNTSDDLSLSYTPSCSIEDASMYLMGYSQSDIQKRWFVCSEDSMGGEYFSKINYQDIVEEWNDAKLSSQKDTILVDATNKYKELHSYKTAIINELAKGTLSNLHVDNTATTDNSNPYITLLSLKKWAKQSLKISILEDLDEYKPSKVIKKSTQQDNAIIEAIKKLNLNPQKLSKNSPGKPGVKAEVREMVLSSPLFNSVNIFNTAWQRLLDKKVISLI